MIRSVKPGGILLIWDMATGTKLISVCMKFYCMWVMAIDTANSFMVHFTLNIGAIDIYFIINLPIHMICGYLHIRRPWLNHLGKEMIEKRIVGMMPGVYKSTTGMAFCTGFDLCGIAAVDIG